MPRNRKHRSAPGALTVALCAGYFLILLDVTVVNVALPSIGRGLHASASGLAWVVDAYTVPLAALLLAAGAVGDRLGHRRVVLLGFACFAAASAMCALAPALAVLNAGRAAQGIAAALMLPGTLAMITDSAPTDHDRTRAIGVWAAIGGAALPAGPFVGGVLAQAAGWRSVFWLNVPIIVAAAVVVARHGTAGRAATRRGAGQDTVDWPVDWAGAAAMVLTIGSLVLAIIEGHRDPAILAAGLVVAALGALVLALAERRSAHPLLAVPAGRRAALGAACAVAAVMNMTVLGSLFLFTQLFQSVHGMGPFQSGLLVLPAMLPLPLLATTSTRMIARLGGWPTAGIGLSVGAAGYAVMAASVSGPTYPALLGGFVLWGSGVGLLTPAVVAGAMAAVPETPGLASGASNTARQTGAAVGVALFGALAGGAATGASGGQFVDRVHWVLAGCAVVFAATALASRALQRTLLARRALQRARG